MSALKTMKNEEHEEESLEAHHEIDEVNDVQYLYSIPGEIDDYDDVKYMYTVNLNEYNNFIYLCIICLLRYFEYKVHQKYIEAFLLCHLKVRKKRLYFATSRRSFGTTLGLVGSEKKNHELGVVSGIGPAGTSIAIVFPKPHLGLGFSRSDRPAGCSYHDFRGRLGSKGKRSIF